MADGDDPYRVAGASRLGRVVATFSTPRRARYAGSARVVSRPGLLTLGSLGPPPTSSTTLSWTRRVPGESVEVCERGLRLRGRGGTLELSWDQIIAWDRVEQGGILLAIELSGIHGEQVRFNRGLRGLDELYAAVDRRRQG